MNDDKPKSVWKKSWRGRWLILLVPGAALFITLVALLVIDHGRINRDWDFVIAVAGCSVAGILLALFVRWLCCWKNFRRFLFGLACFITLIALFYAEEDWRGKHDWEKFKRQWEAKGEHFDYASVIPPTVPDDQNFAMAPIWVELIEADGGTNNAVKLYGKRLVELERAGLTNALQMNTYDWDNSDQGPAIGNWEKGTLTDLKRWQNYYRTLAALTNVFPIPPRPQSPPADVLLALSKYDSAIEELRQASRLPYSRFPLDYDTEPPAAILLPHLATLKRCSQVLQLRAIAELQNGQSDQALADVKLMLCLANSIRTEPFLISHLVRIAIVNITLQPIYEGLAEHKWSDAQLAELEQELGKLDLLSGYEVGMRGEMVLCQIGNIEYLRRLPEQLPNLVGEGGSETRRMAQICRLIPDGWFYQNELRCARLMLEFYLPTVDPNQGMVSPSGVRKADAAAEADVKHHNPYNVLERLLLPALGPASRKFAWDQESVDLARVACALERCRLVHGAFPESLDSLALQFIPNLPHDIINGRPLHYHRTSDGQFVLYSVGWNETDDGGSVVFYKGSSDRVDINKGDWVWRYPSKAE
jgi:hypothetical protein